jgi:hypothetical protein
MRLRRAAICHDRLKLTAIFRRDVSVAVDTVVTALYSFASHRRAALISEKLPKVSAKPIVFGAGAPKA